jgi:4-amino-4-deoxy-L-arabinose transferase-like glycosyltransferase
MALSGWSNLTESIYSKTPANTIDSSPSHFHFNLLLTLAILLFILARFWRLTSSCLWFDEIFSVHAAEHSWSGLVRFVAADLVHPPLFYLLLKVWIAVGGESLLWLRLFPATVSVAAIIPCVLLARELKLNTSETALAVLFLAVNGFLIKYAQEVRMYGLLFFLSACSLWLFVSISRSEHSSKWRWAALTLTNLLLVYTHYYGWLMVSVQLIIVLLLCRKRTRGAIISSALLILAYVPWLIELARAYDAHRVTQNIGWIPRPGLHAFAELFTLLNQPFVFQQSSAQSSFNLIIFVLMFLLFGVPLIILGRQTLRQRWESSNHLLILLAAFGLAPIIFVAGASWLLPHSIWGTRHLVIVMTPYAILAATAVARLRPYWARVTIVLLFGCWLTLAAGYAVIRPAPNFIWCAWTPLAQQLDQTTETSSGSTPVYAFEDLVAYHLWFALRNSAPAKFRVGVIKGIPGVTEDPAYFLPRDFSGVSNRSTNGPFEDKIWIAYRASKLDETQAPLSYFKQAGYQIGERLSEHAPGQDAFLISLQRK